MAIGSYFLAASTANKMFTVKEVKDFVTDLLHEQIIRFPAAILVGEARNMTSFKLYPAEYGEDVNDFIIPNSPEMMLEYVEEQNLSSKLLWYRGTNEQAFFERLKHLPLGEKDCCLCFSHVHKQLAQMGWDSAVIYLLTHPFPMEFCDPIGTNLVPLVEQPLAHYFILSSSIGAAMDQETNPLEAILKRYFSPHLLIRETF